MVEWIIIIVLCLLIGIWGEIRFSMGKDHGVENCLLHLMHSGVIILHKDGTITGVANSRRTPTGE